VFFDELGHLAERFQTPRANKTNARDGANELRAA
jgi:hypothetical protein